MRHPRGSGVRALLLLLGTLSLSASPSSASCSPPEIDVDRARVSAGQTIAVSGSGWAESCRNPREGGCGRDDRPDPPPVTVIEVSLVPPGGGTPVPLGTVDADGEYGVELDALVPPRTPPGRYTVDARAGDHVAEPPVSIVVTRR